jgi:hypothetical protein
VPITKPFVSLIGAGTGRTVVTWSSRASDLDASGHQVGTFNSASVAVEADYFCASHITFEVSAPLLKNGRVRSLLASRRWLYVNAVARDPSAELRAGGAAGRGRAAGGGAAALRRQDRAVQVQGPRHAGHALRQHREALLLQLPHPGLH